MNKFLMIWGVMLGVVVFTALLGAFVSWLLTTAALYAGTAGAGVVLVILTTSVLAGAVYLLEEF